MSLPFSTPWLPILFGFTLLTYPRAGIRDRSATKISKCGKKRTSAQNNQRHTYLAETAAAASFAAFCAVAAAASASYAAVSPKPKGTVLLHFLPIWPSSPHLLHFRFFLLPPSAAPLILLVLGLPGGLVRTGGHSLNPGGHTDKIKTN